MGIEKKDEEQAGSESKSCSYHLVSRIKELSHVSSLHLQVINSLSSVEVLPNLGSSYMAALDKFIREADIFRPQWPELWKGYLKPWLRSAIEVDDSSSLCISKTCILLIP